MTEYQEVSAEDVAAAVQDFAAALAKAIAPVIQAAAGALNALAQHPAVKLAIEHPEIFQRHEPEESCHCLCGHVPDMRGICHGRAVTHRVYETEALGRVEVPLCQPCAKAQGVSTAGGAS